MKKLLLSVMALLSMTISANAGTIVGNEDNTSAFFTAFSDYYTLTGDGSVTFKFTNYSDKVQNWDNWLCVCTNDNDRGATGYAEHFVLRVDNYGWGTDWSADGLESNYNWDTFKDDMDSSTVYLTFIRMGNNIKVRANITTAGDEPKYYRETYVKTIDNLEESIRIFLTTEKGHLDITEASVNKPDYVALGNVGNYEGYSSTVIPEVNNVYVEVYSDSILVRDLCGVSGYDLSVVVDESGNVSAAYPIVYGVANPYVNSGYSYIDTGLDSPVMLAAYLGTNYAYAASEADSKSGVVLLQSYVYYDWTYTSYAWSYYFCGWGDYAPTTAIKTVKANAADDNAPMFNLAGQRVNASAKGLVIKNGKKMILK